MFKTVFNRMIHISKSNLLRGSGKRSNPGAAYQLRVIDSTKEITDDFSEVESDFMDVHLSHKRHEYESKNLREQTKLKVVKQKYFKDKFPNFLTYAEKEQIKLLYQVDQEEWTVDKLVESFPASSEIIRKIIRSNWKPHSKKRLYQHDISVRKNWELFKEGKYSNLPAEYREHLNKFSNREQKNLSQKMQNNEGSLQSGPTVLAPKRQTFASIVNSLEKYQGSQFNQQFLANIKQTTNHPQLSSSSHRPENTYLNNKLKGKRIMRLRELKSLKLNQSQLNLMEEGSSETVNLNDTGVPHNSKNFTGATNRHKISDSDLNVVQKLQNSEIVISHNDRKRFDITNVKNKICIPKKLWQKGATYKVDDCYYDDDGEFIYRVPGISIK